MKLIKEIIQGAGYLEGFGHHPGTQITLFSIAICGLSGVAGGLRGMISGAIIGALSVIPVWCIGCVTRARAYQREGVRMFESLRD